MNDNDIEREVAVFFDRQIPIHIALKNGRFVNGIINELSNDFFMLNDRELGDLPVFYSQIYKIEKLKEKCEEEENNSN